MDYEQLVTVMRRLSIEAGDKIMEIYGADDFEVKTKSDESPVTIADEAADKIISDGLRAAFPDVMLVTEEQSATHSASGDTFLIVDPLDGTKEFINRRGDFTVNIALVEGGVPTRGVVYAPPVRACSSRWPMAARSRKPAISQKTAWALCSRYQSLRRIMPR